MEVHHLIGEASSALGKNQQAVSPFDERRGDICTLSVGTGALYRDRREEEREEEALPSLVKKIVDRCCNDELLAVPRGNRAEERERVEVADVIRREDQRLRFRVDLFEAVE